MRADDDLSVGVLPRLENMVNQFGQSAYDLLVQGQFRFLKQKERISLHERPEQPDQPKSAIGELFFPLPCAFVPPVLEVHLQMRRTRDFVLFERQFAKLRNDLAQCSLYPSQSRALCLALRFRDALEKSLAERIAVKTVSSDLVSMLQKLGTR